jgi:hypothetical protein
MIAPIGAALLPGIAGFQVLAKTQDAEKARFAKQPQVAREIEYFKANIGKVNSPADLVKDRRLLAVALEAFGLGSDVNSQARIRKVLEGGTLQPESLANKLVDPRYKEIAAAFQFDLVDGDKLKDPAFVQTIIDRYTPTMFEDTIGDTNPNLQKALYFKRKMATATNWYSVLADKALFSVVKTSLGLPDSFSKIDVDRQAAFLESKISLAKFKSPAQVENYARKFMAVSTSLNQGATINPALELLNQMNPRRSSSLSSETFSALLQAQGLG